MENWMILFKQVSSITVALGLLYLIIQWLLKHVDKLLNLNQKYTDSIKLLQDDANNLRNEIIAWRATAQTAFTNLRKEHELIEKAIDKLK